MWAFDLLFDQSQTEADEPKLWQTVPTEIRIGRMGYRTKTTKAGRRLEADIYPIWPQADAGRARAARSNATPEKIRRQNELHAERYFVQLADANFNEQDIHLTLTYGGDAPDRERAQKDVRNFLARVRRRRERAGLSELKYIYTIEAEPQRTHVHMLMCGGLDRETLEQLWGKGYANSDRLQPNEDGLQQIARYLTKQHTGRKGRRKWTPSKNLTKPSVRVSDTKLSNRKVRKIAQDFENQAKAVLEKVYPGYTFCEAQVRYSEMVDGVYIRAVMRQMTGGMRNETGRSASPVPMAPAGG